MALVKMPGLVDIQKMKVSTNEKKRQVRHLRFLVQCLVNAQPLPSASLVKALPQNSPHKVSALNLRLEGIHVQHLNWRLTFVLVGQIFGHSCISHSELGCEESISNIELI
jgi:hypothetical protein